MARIEFDKKTKEQAVGKLTRYLKDELDIEVSGFDADFLFDFIGEALGPYFYNQGLHDAQALFAAKVELITEGVYELEKPVKG